MCSLLFTLQGKRICSKAKDVMVWTASKNGLFTVKSNYNLLVRENEGHFPRNLVWNSHIPTKVSFFAREAWWGKILTLDQFKKRGKHLAI